MPYKDDVENVWVTEELREGQYLEFEDREQWLHARPLADGSQYEMVLFPVHGGPTEEGEFVVLTRTLPTLLADVRVHTAALRLLLRANAMGMAPRLRDYAEIQAPLIAALGKLRQAHIGQDLTSRLVMAATDTELWRSGLSELLHRMEESPTPDREWIALRRVLDEEDLAALVGVDRTSVSRFIEREERTPDDVASRLHHVSLIVADLATAYNDYGIRRWFHRKRVQLDGQAPADLLAGSWDPDDRGPQAVRILAEGLLGAQAT